MITHAKGSFSLGPGDYFPRITRGHGSQQVGKCNACKNPSQAAQHIASARDGNRKLVGREANLFLHMQGER